MASPSRSGSVATNSSVALVAARRSSSSVLVLLRTGTYWGVKFFFTSTPSLLAGRSFR
jgi:hypothetical protein